MFAQHIQIIYATRTTRQNCRSTYVVRCYRRCHPDGLQFIYACINNSREKHLRQLIMKTLRNGRLRYDVMPMYKSVSHQSYNKCIYSVIAQVLSVFFRHLIPKARLKCSALFLLFYICNKADASTRFLDSGISYPNHFTTSMNVLAPAAPLHKFISGNVWQPFLKSISFWARACTSRQWYNASSSRSVAELPAS